MPDAWPEVAFGDVFDISSSKRVLESQWKTRGVPFYRAREIVRLSKDGKVENELFISEELYDKLKDKSAVPAPGDLVVSAVGTLGACYVVQPGDRFYFKDASVLLFKPQPGVNSRFIWHAFQTDSIREQINAGSGSTVGTYTISRAKQTRLRLPSLGEQCRIAAILDKADVLRAKRREAIAKLDQLLQSVFLNMFGDPQSNPKGWPSLRLDEVCSLVNGRAFKPEEWEEKGMPIIRIQNLNNSSKPFNFTTRQFSERFRVKTGDVLFSWSGTPGTSFGCFRWRGPEGWLNQHIFNVRLNGVLDSEFFIAQLNLKLNELIAKAHGGVGLQHVTKKMVDETKLMVPPADMQVAFATNLASIRALREKHVRSLDSLGAAFSSLQRRAFTGTL